MSKLIVEMEMPKSCEFCHMANWNKLNELTGCDAVSGKRNVPDNDEFWNKGRPSWCPIKGVLPEQHGDLIDRDVLYMAVKSHDTSDAAIARNHGKVTSLQNISTMRKGYIAEKHICLDDIIRAEAVIAAERRGDE